MELHMPLVRMIWMGGIRVCGVVFALVRRSEIDVRILVASGVILALVGLSSCKHGTTGPDGPLPGGSTEVNVPWSSLANSAWPTFAHDFQHTGRSPFIGPQKGELDWFFETGDQVQSSPVIDQAGRVLVPSLDNHLFAITSLGALAWKFDLGSPSAALTTVASDGTVYACPPVGGIFYALNSGGGAEWGFQVGGEAAFGAPVLSQDGEVIYFAARDSTDASTLGYFYSLFALRKDGTVKWKFTPPGHDLTAHAPAISPDGRTLYCPGYGRPEAALYAVDTSGNLRWRYSVSTTNSAVSGTSSPSLDNAGNLYFAGGGTLYSITSAGAPR